MKDMIEHIRDVVRERGFSVPEDVASVERAIEKEPTSSALWILRGDLIQLMDDDSRPLSEARGSYETAIRHDPESAQAHEELGRFIDAVEDEPAKAEPFLRKAVALGGGDSARQGLSDVLEQLKERS